MATAILTAASTSAKLLVSPQNLDISVSHSNKFKFLDRRKRTIN